MTQEDIVVKKAKKMLKGLLESDSFLNTEDRTKRVEVKNIVGVKIEMFFYDQYGQKKSAEVDICDTKND